MTQRAVIVLVFGPSGIGKSPLDEIFRDEVRRLEPHRVRDAPRDSLDRYYLSKIAHTGILSLLAGQEPKGPFGGASHIIVYSTVALFKVRAEDQVLFRPGDGVPSGATKVEVFGPVFRDLLDQRGTVGWLDALLSGTVFAIFLNPWSRPFAQVDPAAAGNPALPDGRVLVDLLEQRHEPPAKIERRVTNVVEELRAWRSIAAVTDEGFHVLEAVAWPYAEWTYPQPGDPNRATRLRQAKDTLVALARAGLAPGDVALFESLLKHDDAFR